ncbi:MAG: hypothetical protein H6Q30_1842 [Bacteroidetes bacterium]|jgi:hypothetical protein|nr:hypothetical protein [Bacteroidota bacterium]
MTYRVNRLEVNRHNMQEKLEQLLTKLLGARYLAYCKKTHKPLIPIPASQGNK